MLDQLIEYFKLGLMIGGFFPLIIGLMTCISWTLPIKPPADTSNRINRIRLWWYAVSAPHRSIRSFYWLQGDETDNLKDDTWSNYHD